MHMGTLMFLCDAKENPLVPTFLAKHGKQTYDDAIKNKQKSQ